MYVKLYLISVLNKSTQLTDDPVVILPAYKSDCTFKKLLKTEVFIMDRSTLRDPLLVFNITDFYYNYSEFSVKYANYTPNCSDIF